MKHIIILTFILFGIEISAQGDYKMKSNDSQVEIDFLSSYYGQNGDNGAVTGGIGTEQLTDFANIIVVNIPLDSAQSINVSAGLDIYSSASTDNIDNNRSSASSMDVRSYGNVSYSRKILSKGWTLGGRTGFSTEYDYVSFSGGVNVTKEFNNGNSEVSFSGQAFFDNWKTYYPVELRGKVDVPTTNRNSYNAQLTFSQVLSQRIQMSLSGEIILMEGLLSTPFHRVYFSDQELPDIERLPESRLKIPLALRLNYKASDNLIVRTYYRYYSDDFGIQAHTVNLELPIYLSDVWTISPFYRYHTQSGSKYFLPYQGHLSTSSYYTSDFDLSELVSHKFGVGFSYNPIFGISRMALPLIDKIFMINSISLRLSRYYRDTGLDGYAAGLHINMRF